MDLPVDAHDREENMAGSVSNLLAPSRAVRLSQKAVDRFGRLNDRLRLLMLDTIDEYLVEKSSLSDTYFNLLAQKDSQATAKLNRSASLLAKLSVFFLPISFMTSYFSIQIPDLVSGPTTPMEIHWKADRGCVHLETVPRGLGPNFTDLYDFAR